MRARLRQGRPATGRVLERSVMSSKLAERATKAWAKAKLDCITLHECRHTYASLLMAAGYTLKELIEFMGHADLADGQPLRQAGSVSVATPRSILLRRVLGCLRDYPHDNTSGAIAQRLGRISQDEIEVALRALEDQGLVLRAGDHSQLTRRGWQSAV